MPARESSPSLSARTGPGPGTRLDSPGMVRLVATGSATYRYRGDA